MTDRLVLLIIMLLSIFNAIESGLSYLLLRSLVEHSLLVGELLLKISRLVVPGGFGA